jgi:phosphatidylinositol-3-phosphatase
VRRLDPTRLDLALPRPWVCVLLVVAFLGFGVIVGRTASSAENGQLSASARPQLRLVLPAGGASSASTSSASSSATPPPVAESAATPASSPSSSQASSSEAAEAGGSEEGSQNVKGKGGKGGASGDSGKKGAGAGKGAGSGASGGGGHSGGKGGGESGEGGGEGGEGGGSGGKGGDAGGGGGAAGSAKLPPVKHVFLIMLADQPYASVFGPASAAPYLAGTLEHRGELLVRYYAVAHDELADGIALLSGQGPTPQTEVNCPTYAPIAPASVGADEQVTGQGCVYPASTRTLMGELAAKHLTWKAYVEGMDSGDGAGPAACLHPVLGAADATLGSTPPAVSATGPAVDQVPPAYEPTPGASYATFRNPFLYFQSVIGGSACAADDVNIGQLAGDLASPARTPNFSYIVPSLCDDGSPIPCAAGAPAGMAPADAFLRKVVPQITASSAYRHGGLLIVTADQAPSAGADADSSSCCGQPRFPDLPAPASPAQTGLRAAGGGQVGALLLSPYVKSGTTDAEPFNDFSLLRTIEKLFGLAPLGYAAAADIGSFKASVFSAYSG